MKKIKQNYFKKRIDANKLNQRRLGILAVLLIVLAVLLFAVSSGTNLYGYAKGKHSQTPKKIQEQLKTKQKEAQKEAQKKAAKAANRLAKTRSEECQPFQNVVNFKAKEGEIGYPKTYHPDPMWQQYIEGMRQIPKSGIQPQWVVDTGEVVGYVRSATNKQLYCR